jgi:hypothetical protein
VVGTAVEGTEGTAVEGIAGTAVVVAAVVGECGAVVAMTTAASTAAKATQLLTLDIFGAGKSFAKQPTQCDHTHVVPVTYEQPAS